MTDWADDLSRVNELRETITDNSDALLSSAEELLELAYHEEWSVQRAAVEALGIGLVDRPSVGVSELDTLIRTALDETVPAPNRLRDGLVAVASTAPETTCEAALNEFDTIAPEQRGDAGAACVARVLERIAVDHPAVVVDSLDAFRTVYASVPPSARTHLLGAHLALVDSHRETVRPVLPDLVSEYDGGNSDTRRVAADLLCALAMHPKDGPNVVEMILRWLATHSRSHCEHLPQRRPRDPVMRPTLTGSPPSGMRGVAQVLARVAEETPAAVAPHCETITASLRAWESTRTDQWTRSHLTRAVAAVARQRPQRVVSIADDVQTVLADDSEFVRYWATQTLLALYPYRPDSVSARTIGNLLSDSNPDIRGLGADIAIGCISDGIVESESLTTEIRATLLADTSLRSQRALEILSSIADHHPKAVRPALPMLEEFLGDTLTANEAAAVFETIAEQNPADVTEAVPTLVDCLFVDSLTVRTSAADTLVTIGTAHPSLLDEQLSVLLSVLDQEHAGVDAVGDVLVTVADRPFDGDQTVFEFVCDRSEADASTVRVIATRVLKAFIEADIETERTVTALLERLDDTDEQVRKTAVASLATHIANTGAESLVQSCYRTGTDQWRTISADLLARATLYDGTWSSPDFQRWLAGRLRETSGATRRTFVEATGHICGQTVPEDELVLALFECLDDHTVARAAFTAIRDIVIEGETTVPVSELAVGVERAVLDPERDIPSSCLALVPHVATDIRTPQRVADRLVNRFSSAKTDAGRLAAALAGLCSRDVVLPKAGIVAALDHYATHEPISPRDWTCKHFGCVLRAINGGKALRDTFEPMASSTTENTKRRVTAYNVLGSVAEVWPTGIRPAADTLREGIRADDERVRNSALSALVAVGREFPTVLPPVVDWIISKNVSSDSVEMRRRRNEGITLMAADGSDISGAAYRPLRAGLLDNDTAVKEFALEATAELADARLRPILMRLDNGVPDWGELPTHCRTQSQSDLHYEDLLPSTRRALTASDVLAQLDQ